MRNPHTAKKNSPHSPQLEKNPSSIEDPPQSKIKINKHFKNKIIFKKLQTQLSKKRKEV